MNSKKELKFINAQFVGYVIQKLQSGYLVEINSKKYHAVKALSCLVEPETNDKVLLFKDSEEIYILHILQRKNDKIEINLNELDINVKSLNTYIADSNNIIKNLHLNISSFLLKTEIFEHISKNVKKLFDTVKLKSLTNIEISERKIINTDIYKKNTKIDVTRSDNIVIDAEKEIKIDSKIINMG